MTFLGSKPFGNLLDDFRLTALDIGARDGFTHDLDPLAKAVRAIGFEPDAEECDQLNQHSEDSAYRTLQFIPAAPGKTSERRPLHLYKKRGCSSFLKAKENFGREFCREEYYELEDVVTVDTIPLDQLAITYNFQETRYLKIDVQGLEEEILENATNLLKNSVVALRLEVSFVPQYEGQPLFSEIETLLRPFGFIPMGWLETHSWRKTTPRNLPKLSKGMYPFSRGQLIHGDMLFMIDPNKKQNPIQNDLDKQLSYLFVALSYGYIDHAEQITHKEPISSFLREKKGIDVEQELSKISKAHGKQHWIKHWKTIANLFATQFKQAFKLF